MTWVQVQATLLGGLVLLSLSAPRRVLADGVGELPDFIPAVFDLAEAHVKGITATVRWRSPSPYAREGKPPLQMQGLTFEVKVTPGGVRQRPTVEAKLKGARPAGATDDDVEGMQFTTAGLVGYGFESPFDSIADLAAAPGAARHVDAAARTLKLTRPPGEGVITDCIEFQTTAMGDLVHVTIKGEGLLDRTMTYLVDTVDGHPVVAGSFQPQTAQVWRGIHRAILYQVVDGVPVPRSIYDSSCDDTATPPQSIDHVELTDLRVSK